MLVNQVVSTYSHWYEISKVHLGPELLSHHFVERDTLQKHWLPTYWSHVNPWSFFITIPPFLPFHHRCQSVVLCWWSPCAETQFGPTHRVCNKMREWLQSQCIHLCLTFHYPCFEHPSIHICSFLQFACHCIHSMHWPINSKWIHGKWCMIVNVPDQATRRFQRYTSFDWILEEERERSIQHPQKTTGDYGIGWRQLLATWIWIVSTAYLNGGTTFWILCAMRSRCAALYWEMPDLRASRLLIHVLSMDGRHGLIYNWQRRWSSTCCSLPMHLSFPAQVHYSLSTSLCNPNKTLYTVAF